MEHALEGLKVIEIATTGPANMASQWLGDLGADVTIIEAPVKRSSGAEWSAGERFSPENNRNKRGIGLDLKQDEGREVLYRMVKDADILIEANRPGVAKRLGYDYETLSKINPRIIFCASTGYGQEGPYKMLAGHGLAWEATGGWLMAQGMGYGNSSGVFTGKPWVNYYNLPDIKTAPYWLSTILAALYARERTGEGQYLDLAIVDAAIAVQKPGIAPAGDEAYHRTGPSWNLYECKDGKYVATCAGEAIQWANLMKGIGLPELAEDNGRANRTPEREEEIISILRRRFLRRTRDEWIEDLVKLDTDIAPVLSMEESKNHPAIQARKMHVEVRDDAGYCEV